MSFRHALLAALAVVMACSIAPPEDADTGTSPRTWKQVMIQVDERFDIIATELGKSPPGDLAAVSAAASDSAELLRLGYGEFHDAHVSGFDRMARDAESWMLRLAAEAGQARGRMAQEVFRGGEARYCQRCHDASKAR